jgi:hypothetical protein
MFLALMAQFVKDVIGRVTRLGEFSTNGRLLTLRVFSKITEVAQNVGLIFTKV